MDKDKKYCMVIICFILILTLPFSNKAYHFDDVAFIYIADQISRDPLRPYSFIVEWGNSAKPGVYLSDTPLISYYISIISWIFGKTEVVLHISYLLFHLIGGISFYFIARRFIGNKMHSLLSSLALLSTPTFLVNSHNLMLDAPILSFVLLSLVLFIRGVDNNSKKFLIAGSIAAGIAYLAKPTAIIVIPLLAAYSYIHGKPRYIFYQAIPAVFVALFALHNYLFESEVILLHYASQLISNKPELSLLLAHIFSNFSYIGGATIFPIFLFFPFMLKKRNWALLAFSALIALAASIGVYSASPDFISGKYSLFQLSLFFLFTTGSIFFILLVIAENYQNLKSGAISIIRMAKLDFDRDKFFIFIWFIGMIVFNTLIVGGAVRWNTLLLPPLVLFYFVMLRDYSRMFDLSMPRIMTFALFLTLLSGIVTAYADYEYAGVYRDFAEKAPQDYKSPNNTVHFLGGADFQYYMAENSYRMLPENDNSPQKGDIIIKAAELFPRKMAPELSARVQLIRTISYGGAIPVRIQNSRSHAGFYTYAGGFLPYSFSNSKLENFEVYYVKS